MIFYGTGAAEGIPNPFCDCPTCKNARQKKGQEIRTRSMFRIDPASCIDLGADSFYQALLYGDFINLRHVLVTHTHEDHFAHMMLNVRNMALSIPCEPLHIYLTAKAYDLVDFLIKSKPLIKGVTDELIQRKIIAFHKLDYYTTAQIGNMKVIPLRGNHLGNMQENSANYLIQKDNGERFFYGLDTGYYFEEVFDYLTDFTLDYMISECTFGLSSDRGEKPDGHLDAASCMQVFQKLYEQGTLDDHTKIYLTHINHYKGTHTELIDYFRKQDFPCSITVAYDGMSIEDMQYVKNKP